MAKLNYKKVCKMNVIFCKITSMKYYKGVTFYDQPSRGGSYIDENGTGGDVTNFYPTKDADGEEVCFGFVEPKHNHGVTNTIHLENITGNIADKEAEYVDDVLVIWCATLDTHHPAVVGWYKNSTFYRTIQEVMIDDYYYPYNALAKADDCVLLPRNESDKGIWSIPVSRYDGYGFGQSMIYYPQSDFDKQKVKKIIESIESYAGNNWLRVFNEDQEPKPEKKYFWQK